MGYAPLGIFILAGLVVFGLRPDGDFALFIFAVLALACSFWVVAAVAMAEITRGELKKIADASTDMGKLRGLKLTKFGRTLVDREKGFTTKAVHLNLDQALDEVGELWRVGLEQVPGVFTALGILFTFYGLVSGLHGFDLTQGSDQMMQDLSGLLSGVGVAFHTSLWGIGLSICALLATRQAIAGLGKAVDAVRECAEKKEIELQSSPHELLKAIRNFLLGIDESGKEQSQKLGTLATDLANMVGEAVGKVISEPMTELRGSFDRFANHQNDQNAAALHEVMAQFQGAFGEMLGEQLGHLGESLDKTLLWHERTQKMLEDTLNQLHLNTNSMRNVLDTEQKLLTLRAQEQQRSVEIVTEGVERLASVEISVRELSRALESAQRDWKIQSDHVAQSAAVSTQMLVSINTTLGEEYRRLEELIGTLNESIVFSQTEYNRLIATLRQELNTNLKGTFQVFDSSTAKVVDQFSGTLAGIRDTTDELNKTLEHMRTARFPSVGN